MPSHFAERPASSARGGTRARSYRQLLEGVDGAGTRCGARNDLRGWRQSTAGRGSRVPERARRPAVAASRDSRPEVAQLGFRGASIVATKVSCGLAIHDDEASDRLKGRQSLGCRPLHGWFCPTRCARRRRARRRARRQRALRAPPAAPRAPCRRPRRRRRRRSGRGRGRSPAPRRRQAHRVARAEVAPHAEHADREHALALRAHGLGGAAVEHDVAARAQREGDPVLLRAEPLGRGDEERAHVLAGEDRVERSRRRARRRRRRWRRRAWRGAPPRPCSPCRRCRRRSSTLRTCGSASRATSRTTAMRRPAPSSRPSTSLSRTTRSASTSGATIAASWSLSPNLISSTATESFSLRMGTAPASSSAPSAARALLRADAVGEVGVREEHLRDGDARARRRPPRRRA